MQSCVGTLHAAERILSILSPLAVLCLLWWIMRERRYRRHALVLMFGASSDADPTAPPDGANRGAEIIDLEGRRP